MFFSDNDVHPRIEKASMDGSDRTVIVYSGLLRVLSLTVDADNNLLFWADVNRHTLEVSNYNGSNRRVIRRQRQVLLNSVVYHRNILHVVSASARLILGYDVTVGSLMYGINTSKDPFTIHVYDAKSLQSHDDSCASRSCQYTCVNTPSGSKCLCAEGYRLLKDGFTCKELSSLYERGCIISNATLFTMLEAHVFNGIQSIVKGIRVPSANIMTFAVDANSRVIYFVDSLSRLRKVDIITRNFQTIASIGSVTDLNFNWIANILIWIERTGSSILTYSINSGSITTIYGGLPQPVSLTVDPYNGFLFWFSGKVQKSIMRGSLSRNFPEAIVSPPNLISPISLHYDTTSKRIYWLDTTSIKSSLTDGSNIKSHVTTLGAIQIFMYKDFFGWMDENSLNFARKSKNSSEHVLSMPIQNPKEIVIYDSSLQRDKNGVCNVLNGDCEDICVPIQSGRKCECDFGLHLQTDLKTCSSDVYSRNFLIVIDNSHGRILQIDINTGSIVKLPISIKNSPGIAFDRSTKELIYFNASDNTIMSTTLNGRNKTLVHATGHAYADRLTIDYSTGNIYYSAVAPIPSQSFIGVVHRKSSLHKTLLSNLHKPKDIVLYPSKGYLYWTDIGSSKEISRSYMDGKSQTYIATTNIGIPTGLAIDFNSNRLYWTDASKDHIEYSDLNGENRHVLITDKDSFPMGIVVLGQHLYYIASNRQGVTKINKTTGSKVTFMSNHPELGVLDSIDVYTDDSVDVSLSCSINNGNCSAFCFPTPNGRTCGCEDGVDLLSDRTTCQGGNTSSQHTNEESFGIYNTYFVIGSSLAAIGGIIFAVVLAIACFLKRRITSRDSYQTSPVHTGHNYSIIRYRRNLAGSYREEGQEATEYVTIDDNAITEYVEPIEDPYLYPVYSY